jgi:hypothetical protein
MQKIYALFFLLCLSFASTSCASAKQKTWLKAHNTTLVETAANTTMGTEAKIDLLLNQYVTLMEQGLAFTNPVKGAKYIQKFQEQNQPSIDRIASESGTWLSELRPEELLVLGFSVLKKPYMKRILELQPQFERKYKQFVFVSQLAGSMKGVFGKLRGNIF